MEDDVGRHGYRTMSGIVAAIGVVGLIAAWYAFRPQGDLFQWLGFFMILGAIGGLFAVVLVVLERIKPVPPGAEASLPSYPGESPTAHEPGHAHDSAPAHHPTAPAYGAAPAPATANYQPAPQAPQAGPYGAPAPSRPAGPANAPSASANPASYPAHRAPPMDATRPAGPPETSPQPIPVQRMKVIGAPVAKRIEYDDAVPAARAAPTKLVVPEAFGEKDPKDWPQRRMASGVKLGDMAERAARQMAVHKPAVMARVWYPQTTMPRGWTRGRCGDCGTALMCPPERPIDLRCPHCDKIKALE